MRLALSREYRPAIEIYKGIAIKGCGNCDMISNSPISAETASSLTDSETIADLRRTVELLQARVTELECPPARWVPLKLGAGEVGISYELARKRAVRGEIEARREGGRWLVNLTSLRQRFSRSPQ